MTEDEIKEAFKIFLKQKKKEHRSTLKAFDIFKGGYTAALEVVLKIILSKQ